MNSRSRDSLIKPFEGYPAFGAVHEIQPNDQFRSFLYAFGKISDKVFMRSIWKENSELPEIEGLFDEDDTPMIIYSDEQEIVDSVYDPRNYYKIFDIESMGVSVVEMDPSAKSARAVGALWERQDFGVVEQEARNEIDRKMPNENPRLKFNRIEGVGKRFPGVDKSEIRKKVALMPDTASNEETFEIIEEEADVVISLLRRRLKQFVYPWDITPHLTFAIFKSYAKPEDVHEIMSKSNEYLEQYPFGVRLDRTLSFRHKSLRGKNARN